MNQIYPVVGLYFTELDGDGRSIVIVGCGIFVSARTPNDV